MIQELQKSAPPKNALHINEFCEAFDVSSSGYYTPFTSPSAQQEKLGTGKI